MACLTFLVCYSYKRKIYMNMTYRKIEFCTILPSNNFFPFLEWIIKKLGKGGLQYSGPCSFAAAAISQLSLRSNGVWMRLQAVRSQRTHSNSALTVLFTTINWICYYGCYLLIGQWDRLLSESFFQTKIYIYHTLIDSSVCIY